MFCTNCGTEIPDGSVFCPECGERLETNENENVKEEPAKETKKPGNSKKRSGEKKLEGTKVTENIYLCPDGKYRWYYEFDMLKNPTILITVFKVFGITVLAVAAFVLLIGLFEGGPAPLASGQGKILIYVILFLIALVLVSYVILAGIYGWKYLVLFEMDEEKIVHMQQPKQFEKAKAIGWLTVMAGGLSNNLTTSAVGLNIMEKNKSVSAYRNVKKVKSSRQLNTIYLNEGLEHNQIYAADADYDFVMDYISQRCDNAKIYR